jgi:ribosomal protein S18 acetylase RimI-like enzyme
MHVIKGSEAHAEGCMDIAGRLRTHFDDNAMEQMPKDLRSHRLYLVEEDGEVLGFLTIKPGQEGGAEISWMGVRPDLHRKGIGRALVDEAERRLIAGGVERLMVRTLADTVDYEPYEGTRAFYRAVGFVHHETIDPYPEWGPGNPCAVYIKDLC